VTGRRREQLGVCFYEEQIITEPALMRMILSILMIKKKSPPRREGNLLLHAIQAPMLSSTCEKTTTSGPRPKLKYWAVVSRRLAIKNESASRSFVESVGDEIEGWLAPDHQLLIPSYTRPQGLLFLFQPYYRKRRPSCRLCRSKF